MDSFSEGLRCQDVTLGLRELHQASAQLRLVNNTQIVGMAADLAGLIRGRDVIEKIDSLEIVAAETLDIAALLLPAVLDVLEAAGIVETYKQGGRIERITETVPIYRNLYADLGNAWRDRQPRQIEEELIAVVDRLARGPVPLDSLTTELGVDHASWPHFWGPRAAGPAPRGVPHSRSGWGKVLQLLPVAHCRDQQLV
jgi:hypothetical protein